METGAWGNRGESYHVRGVGSCTSTANTTAIKIDFPSRITQDTVLMESSIHTKSDWNIHQPAQKRCTSYKVCCNPFMWRRQKICLSNNQKIKKNKSWPTNGQLSTSFALMRPSSLSNHRNWKKKVTVCQEWALVMWERDTLRLFINLGREKGEWGGGSLSLLPNDY